MVFVYHFRKALSCVLENISIYSRLFSRVAPQRKTGFPLTWDNLSRFEDQAMSVGPSDEYNSPDYLQIGGKQVERALWKLSMVSLIQKDHFMRPYMIYRSFPIQRD